MLQVIHTVRAHRHHYQLELDLGHYADLLSLRYHCDTITQQKEALNCIRAIKNVRLVCVTNKLVFPCLLLNLLVRVLGIEQVFSSVSAPVEFCLRY